eukprot:TRINITY_DN3209_c1_g8_i1.p1 TRINITY_DN3209_c1_g8~~TRINITY_DN3209_c1_g8_i1.p1  ORF type:complete len:1607 (-),score=55.52 TRINITY_DN3209_c1_g8_i1:232-5052(-)
MNGNMPDTPYDTGGVYVCISEQDTEYLREQSEPNEITPVYANIIEEKEAIQTNYPMDALPTGSKLGFHSSTLRKLSYDKVRKEIVAKKPPFFSANTVANQMLSTLRERILRDRRKADSYLNTLSTSLERCSRIASPTGLVRGSSLTNSGKEKAQSNEKIVGSPNAHSNKERWSSGNLSDSHESEEMVQLPSEADLYKNQIASNSNTSKNSILIEDKTASNNEDSTAIRELSVSQDRDKQISHMAYWAGISSESSPLCFDKCSGPENTANTIVDLALPNPIISVGGYLSETEGQIEDICSSSKLMSKTSKVGEVSIPGGTGTNPAIVGQFSCANNDYMLNTSRTSRGFCSSMVIIEGDSEVEEEAEVNQLGKLVTLLEKDLESKEDGELEGSANCQGVSCTEGYENHSTTLSKGARDEHLYTPRRVDGAHTSTPLGECVSDCQLPNPRSLGIDLDSEPEVHTLLTQDTECVIELDSSIEQVRPLPTHRIIRSSGVVSDSMSDEEFALYQLRSRLDSNLIPLQFVPDVIAKLTNGQRKLDVTSEQLSPRTPNGASPRSSPGLRTSDSFDRQWSSAVLAVGQSPCLSAVSSAGVTVPEFEIGVPRPDQSDEEEAPRNEGFSSPFVPSQVLPSIDREVNLDIAFKNKRGNSNALRFPSGGDEPSGYRKITRKFETYDDFISLIKDLLQQCIDYYASVGIYLTFETDENGYKIFMDSSSNDREENFVLSTEQSFYETVTHYFDRRSLLKGKKKAAIRVRVFEDSREERQIHNTNGATPLVKQTCTRCSKCGLMNTICVSKSTSGKSYCVLCAAITGQLAISEEQLAQSAIASPQARIRFHLPDDPYIHKLWGLRVAEGLYLYLTGSDLNGEYLWNLPALYLLKGGPPGALRKRLEQPLYKRKLPKPHKKGRGGYKLESLIKHNRLSGVYKMMKGESTGIIDRPDESEMKKLFPKRKREIMEVKTSDKTRWVDFMHSLRSINENASADLFGWSLPLILPTSETGNGIILLNALFNELHKGNIPESLRQGRLTPLAKPNGGVRPVVMEPMFLKVVSKYLEEQLKQAKIAVVKHQFCYTRSGTTVLARLLQDYLERDYWILGMDLSNAFNTLDRNAFLKKHHLLGSATNYITSLYNKSNWAVFGKKRWEISSGIMQGDPLSPLLFSLGIDDCLDQVSRKYQDVLVLAYQDDIYLVSKKPAWNAGTELSNLLAANDLKTNLKKTFMCGPDSTKTPQGFNISVVSQEEGFKAMGVQIKKGTQSVSMSESMFTMLLQLPKHMAYIIYRRHIQPSFTHIFRAVKPERLDLDPLRSQFTQFCVYIGIPTKQNALTPLKCNGLGVFDPMMLSNVAYFGALDDLMENFPELSELGKDSPLQKEIEKHQVPDRNSIRSFIPSYLSVEKISYQKVRTLLRFKDLIQVGGTSSLEKQFLSPTEGCELLSDEFFVTSLQLYLSRDSESLETQRITLRDTKVQDKRTVRHTKVTKTLVNLARMSGIAGVKENVAITPQVIADFVTSHGHVRENVYDVTIVVPNEGDSIGRTFDRVCLRKSSHYSPTKVHTLALTSFGHMSTELLSFLAFLKRHMSPLVKRFTLPRARYAISLQLMVTRVLSWHSAN